ncbi:hypothetical protein U0C82_13585 [Fulvimarina sp. 2208YS6-2-32]|uniref:Uncharacterized protein n=1 Tax=Fulvimarina uroteuthidis TaxID=3098149 RepID=A0ABU5I4M9_9HYPH|nr:hypothetical protein [Fulvimarina sp. 2208YS6-2-32]
MSHATVSAPQRRPLSDGMKTGLNVRDGRNKTLSFAVKQGARRKPSGAVHPAQILSPA